MLEKTGISRLRPRARLIGLIGEELISDEAVAVVELVKNSYDADASLVKISFGGPDSDLLIVEDDGHGMDLDTVLSTWFEPGTVSKKRNESSPKGRVYQGAKGIGRFASARIARSLLLESAIDTDAEGVSVLFDWGSFKEDSYLDEIEVLWEKGDLGGFSRGTRLTLGGMRKEWTDEDFTELHSRLSRLVSPFDEVRDFTISLDIPSRPDISGPVQPPVLLTRPRYELRGSVNEEGFFSGTMWHSGDLVREFVNEKLGGKDSKPACGPFSTEIRVWDRDREGLAPLAGELAQSITEVRRTLNTYSGVSIYRDGFRVYPYGQRGNDWLQLDNRSRQNPSMRLANNQIVAAIKISRDANQDLSDRSTREGLVMNSAYEELQIWFKEVLQNVEVERYRLRPRENKELHKEALFEAFDIRETVTQTKTALGSQHEVTALIVQLEQQVNEGVERVQDMFSRLLMSAGLGQMVDVVIHEIGAPIGKIVRQLAILERHVGNSKDQQLQKTVKPMIVALRGWLEQLQNLRQRLDPQIAGKRGRTTTFDVIDEVNDTLQLYENILGSQGIAWKIIGPEKPVRVSMARAALGQVLANLVDNAIFWIIRGHESHVGGRIEIEIVPLPTGFMVSVCDDGPGVSEEDQNNIFEPYFTKKPNGIGLGLYIARLVMEPYGRLIYRDNGPLSGACFEAIFEGGVGI